MRRNRLVEGKLTTLVNTIFDALVQGKRDRIYHAIGDDKELKRLVKDLDAAQTKLSGYLTGNARFKDSPRYQQSLRDLS